MKEKCYFIHFSYFIVLEEIWSTFHSFICVNSNLFDEKFGNKQPELFTIEFRIPQFAFGRRMMRTRQPNPPERCGLPTDDL